MLKLETAPCVDFQEKLMIRKEGKHWFYDQGAIDYFEAWSRRFSPAAEITSVVLRPCRTHIVAYGFTKPRTDLSLLPELVDEVLGEGTWDSLYRATMQVPLKKEVKTE
jgi:hypothetical protein